MDTESKYKVTNKTDFLRKVWINGKYEYIEPKNSFTTDYPPEGDGWKIEELKKRTKEKIIGNIEEK